MTDRLTTLTDAIHAAMQEVDYSKVVTLLDYAEAAAKVADEHLLMMCQREAGNIHRADARMEAAEARIRELEAALPRAWEMGRDAGAEQASAYMVKTGFFDAHRHAETIGYALRALTPPADLAERIKEMLK